MSVDQNSFAKVFRCVYVYTLHVIVSWVLIVNNNTLLFDAVFLYKNIFVVGETELWYNLICKMTPRDVYLSYE